ncbi:MAG: hypothetical protein EOO77_22175 [Oxalobacteraceae bacterium]|nr:MAG: hypothetical protein EOO77_22175 [Oxalobacteraceae bacterium]
MLNKYKKELSNYFDRPKPFTINSMFLEKATISKQEATIQWKDQGSAGKGTAAGRYLEPETRGGTRSNKRFERSLQYSGQMPQGYFAVPTDDVALDSFGNVSAGLYTKILSALKSSFDSTQNQTTQKGYKGKNASFVGKYRTFGEKQQAKAAAADNRARKKSAKYFTIQPGQAGGLYPGIYESVVLFGGRGSRRLFSYVKAVNYKNQFPFEQIGFTATDAKFPSKLEEAIDKVVGR